MLYCLDSMFYLGVENRVIGLYNLFSSSFFSKEVCGPDKGRFLHTLYVSNMGSDIVFSSEAVVAQQPTVHPICSSSL